MLVKLRRGGFRLETKAKVWSTSLETVVIVETSGLVREKTRESNRVGGRGRHLCEDDIITCRPLRTANICEIY